MTRSTRRAVAAAWVTLSTVLACVYFFSNNFDAAGMAYAAIPFCAASMLLVVPIIRGLRPRYPWLLLSASIYFLTAGEIMWGSQTQATSTTPPYSIAAWFYSVGYVFLALSLYLMLRLRRVSGSADALLDATIFGLATATIIAQILATAAESSEMSYHYVFWALMDVMILTLAVRHLLEGAPCRASRLLAVSMLFTAVGDIALSLATRGEAGAYPRVLDLFWLTGYVVVALVPLTSSATTLAKVEEHPTDFNVVRWPLWLLFGSLLLAVEVVALTDTQHLELGVVFIALPVIFALFAWRIQRLLKERDQYLSDVIDQKDQLEFKATHDDLTSLVNRFTFVDRASSYVSDQVPSGLIFLDLDRFKLVNDTLGHDAGDLVLQVVAAKLRECSPPDAVVSRFGGDEFCIFVPDVDLEELSRVAHTLSSSLEVPSDLPELGPLSFTATLGFVHTDTLLTTRIPATNSYAPTPHASAPEAVAQLLRCADSALRHGKATGRFAVVQYAPSMSADDGARLQARRDLRHATANRELDVVYQPQVDIRTGYPVGFEALLRWDHPTLGRLSPGEFLETAEDSGAIIEIGSHVLEEAIKTAVAWSSKDFSPRLSVNVSPVQLLRTDVPALVKQLLDKHNCPPSFLTVEVTEKTWMSHHAREQLKKLAALGVGVSLDDFGAGFFSIENLHALPLTELKLDKTLIEQVGSPVVDYMIRTLADLSKLIGCRLVAEGVETDVELEQLRSLGVEIVQGFVFSQPLTVEKALTYASSNR